GQEPFHVPPGTQHGRVFRIKDRGVPRLQRSGRGEFRIVTRVEVPKQLTPRQRELLAELAKTFEGDNGGEAKGVKPSADGQAKKPVRKPGLFDKVKDALGLDEE